MKKLIGIILAVCMLGTLASAATVTGSATASELTDMTVSVTYAGLADGAQATLLAYKVADTATEEAIPAYVDETTTPIVGIDQEVSDGAFTFKVAADFRGKIAVKVGGTDVAAPAAFLVEFADAVVEPEEPEVVPVVVYAGDVNGDGKVNANDASLIQVYAKKLTASQKNTFNTANNSNCGAEYVLASDSTSKYFAGDVNGDGKVNANDASLIKVYAKKLTASQKNTFNTANNSNCGAEISTLPKE